MARPRELTLLRWSGTLALAALALTIWVAVDGVPLPGDLRITRRVQSYPRFEPTAEFINFLGDWNWIAFAAVAAPVFIFGGLGAGNGRGTRHWREAVFAFIGAVLVRYWDQLLKAVLRSPRPLEELGVDVDRMRSTYGFPSGHVYSDVLLFGVLAVFAPVWVTPRLVWPVRTLLTAVIVLSGPARIYVGAHWPTDTLGGYLWGGAALCLVVAYGRWAGRGR